MEIKIVLAASYILLLSLAGFFLMGWDKSQARKGRWRTPERRLLLIALLGGSVGTLLGMKVFHHKTKHWYFKYGVPAILMLQAALAAAWLYWYLLLR